MTRIPGLFRKGRRLTVLLLAAVLLMSGCREATPKPDPSAKPAKPTNPANPSQQTEPAGLAAPPSRHEPIKPPESAEPAEQSAPPKQTDPDFYFTEITDELFRRIDGLSYKKDCTVPREDLRYVHVLHVDPAGNTREGELICNRRIAEELTDIFRKLYEAGYPIGKIRLIDEYGADDELSMEDNNTSCFNFRFLSHADVVSKHGLGLAVDVNPLYNPFVTEVDGEEVLEPVTAEPYADREKDFPCKIDHDDLCYRLFTEHGFDWGGDWIEEKDYQHFELPNEVIAQWYEGYDPPEETEETESPAESAES